MSSYPTLRRLRELRRAADITHTHIEGITAARRMRGGNNKCLDASRLRALENQPQHEPTYNEALTLARILFLPTIGEMLHEGGSIYGMAAMLGPLRDNDIADFRKSRDVPLSTALRITIALGLDDPMELDHHGIHAQIWDILARNERGAGPDECPWCLGRGGYHLPTCVPSVLFVPHETGPVLLSDIPKPAAPRTRGSGRYATGMKVERAKTRYTQKELADQLRRHPNYISRIERCDDKLTEDMAEQIAALFGCTVAALYA